MNEQQLKQLQEEFGFLKKEIFEDENHLLVLLKIVTGNDYVFATASGRVWGNDNGPEESGTFYQIMPRGAVDDGLFDWYCEVRSMQQFFEHKHNAVLHFILYWKIWLVEREIEGTGANYWYTYHKKNK